MKVSIGIGAASSGQRRDFDEIGTEYFEGDKSSALSLFYLQQPDWSPEDDAYMRAIQDDIGYFAKAEVTSQHEDEYPSS
jgi:hypothetical protein